MNREVECVHVEDRPSLRIVHLKHTTDKEEVDIKIVSTDKKTDPKFVVGKKYTIEIKEA